MRPFFPFYGSKWNIARHYPPPEYGTVIEPFAGGAGYSTFYACKNVQLFDADSIVAGTWSYLLGASVSDILALPELPDVGDSVDNYTLPQGARWLIGFWLNRGSATPKKSRTAYSARTDRAQLNWSAAAKERIAKQLPLIGTWRITNASYVSAPDQRCTWFIDPPYGVQGRHYRVRFNDFYMLGKWCRERRGQAIVCENVGAKWLPFEPLGSFKSTRGRTQEAVFLQHMVI